MEAKDDHGAVMKDKEQAGAGKARNGPRGPVAVALAAARDIAKANAEGLLPASDRISMDAKAALFVPAYYLLKGARMKPADALAIFNEAFGTSAEKRKLIIAMSRASRRSEMDREDREIWKRLGNLVFSGKGGCVESVLEKAFDLLEGAPREEGPPPRRPEPSREERPSVPAAVRREPETAGRMEAKKGDASHEGMSSIPSSKDEEGREAPVLDSRPGPSWWNAKGSARYFSDETKPYYGYVWPEESGRPMPKDPSDPMWWSLYADYLLSTKAGLHVKDRDLSQDDRDRMDALKSHVHRHEDRKLAMKVKVEFPGGCVLDVPRRHAERLMAMKSSRTPSSIIWPRSLP
jgi:hypothetical protein